MTTPRWLREQRRWIKACERFPQRLILPMPPHEQAAADFMRDQLWTIPEVATFGHLHPTQRARRIR